MIFTVHWSLHLHYIWNITLHYICNSIEWFISNENIIIFMPKINKAQSEDSAFHFIENYYKIASIKKKML